MSMVAKILIVLNLILSVAVMGAAGAYLESAENWKKMHETDTAALKSESAAKSELITKTQGFLDEANRKVTAAESGRSAAEAANRTLSENNALLQKKMDDYNATLQNLEARVRDLSGNLDSARQANEKLTTEKKQADDERRSALDAKNAAETEQKRLEATVADLTAQLEGSNVAKNDLKEKLSAANAALDIYKSKYPSLGLVSAPVKGMVLAANAEMDIYLISVGEQSGVKVADELTVFRGSDFIAQVVVDKVYADKAAVFIKKLNGKPLKKGEIRQGDSVATVY